MLPADDPLAIEATAAVQRGDVEAVSRLLAAQPSLATTRVGDATMSRTLLHALTDWPGKVPNGPVIARLLLSAGADVNARFAGPHTETPLHWAASSDDVEIIDALLDAGADIEADGAVIAGGTPMADAVAFGQWAAAAQLLLRGARVNLWQAAGLGLVQTVQQIVASDNPSRDDLTNALWCAGHGGQAAAADFLLGLGADPTWVGHDGLTPAGAAERNGHRELAHRLRTLSA